jgi:hypothetical protein
MTWKTYLIMYFGTSDNSSITEIVQKVEALGFKSAIGPVDFLYEWTSEPSKEEIFSLGDKLKKTLHGTGTIFNLDTHD